MRQHALDTTTVTIDQRTEQPPDALLDVVLTWLTDHPELLVKYTDGIRWDMTRWARRDQPLGWFALIRRTDDGLAVTPVGKRIANEGGGFRCVELATPTLLAGDADFAGGMVLSGDLTDAVREALETVDEERRRAIPSHRGTPATARLAARVRERVRGWWTR